MAILAPTTIDPMKLQQFMDLYRQEPNEFGQGQETSSPFSNPATMNYFLELQKKKQEEARKKLAQSYMSQGANKIGSAIAGVPLDTGEYKAERLMAEKEGGGIDAMDLMKMQGQAQKEQENKAYRGRQEKRSDDRTKIAADIRSENQQNMATKNIEKQMKYFAPLQADYQILDNLIDIQGDKPIPGFGLAEGTIKKGWMTPLRIAVAPLVKLFGLPQLSGSNQSAILAGFNEVIKQKAVDLGVDPKDAFNAFLKDVGDKVLKPQEIYNDLKQYGKSFSAGYKDAADVIMAYQALYDRILKQMSGTAVSKWEEARLKREMGLEGYTTEENFRNVLKRLGARLYKELENVEAGYKSRFPQVLSEYQKYSSTGTHTLNKPDFKSFKLRGNVPKGTENPIPQIGGAVIDDKMNGFIDFLKTNNIKYGE